LTITCPQKVTLSLPQQGGGSVNHLCAKFSWCALFLGSVLIAGSASAQTKAYRQTNLVSTVPGAALDQSPSLINPGAISFLPGSPFFIADSGSGLVTSQNSSGAQAGAVGIPVSAEDAARSVPTDIVSDGSGMFGPSSAPFQFVVVTQSGTISGFSTQNGIAPAQATLVRDDSAKGAVYTALAILRPNCCAPFIAVANFDDGLIHTFSSSFAPADKPGSFHDPSLPAGYSPYGMEMIGNQLYVTYALHDAARRGAVIGAGNGIVNIFDAQGNFVRRFATSGSLNAPWGIALAGANFGPFSRAILVSNFGDGTISAFDAASGNFLGHVHDGDGNVITNPGIRGLAFRAEGVADPNTLFFTAGAGNGQGGLFAAITTGLFSNTRVSAPAATANASATVIATVDAGFSNPGAPSGAVAFTDNGVPQGVAPLVNGAATFNFTGAGLGMHLVGAQYSGDAAFLTSSSTTEMQVSGAGTTVALTVPAKVVHGSPVTMTASIKSTGGIPTGNIMFQEGAVALGSAPMNPMGVASITLNKLAVGTHSMTASFAGTGTFAGSTSSTVVAEVTGGPDFAVTTSPTSVSVTAGQSARVMVTVTPSGGFTGSVTLSCSSAVPGITCTFTSASLAITSGPLSTNMNVNTAMTVPRYGFVLPGGVGLGGGLLGALGILGLIILRAGEFARIRVPVLATAAILTISAFSLALGGCGYGSGTSYMPPSNPGPAMLTVTGQSGSTSHTATVNITVQ
jgi:uncharacterized protein (TIGR03118 family)